MARCGGCSTLIFGPSYSCLECLFNSADHGFTLCRNCYATGNVWHGHPLTSSSTSTAADLLQHQALLTRFRDLISTHPSPSPTKKDLINLWKVAKSQIGPASPAMELMAENYFESMGCNNTLDIAKFSSTLNNQHEAFLTPTPDSDLTTNYMKNMLAMKLRHPNGLPTTSTAYDSHHHIASSSFSSSSSPPETYYANHSPSYHPNPQTSSNGTSPLKAVITTFEVVDMALTIASLSGMCTIL